MQESEAKAYFLRDLRKSREAISAFYKLPHEFSSKKHVLQFLKAFRDVHQNVTLFEYKKPSRHPWHYQHTFFYLEPTAFDEEGIGKLIMVQKSTLDSKKLIKGDLEELLKVDLATDAMFHAHFFIRLIQRSNLHGLKPALEIVAHSLAMLLIYNQEQRDKLEMGQTLYVVFPDKVFVVTIETEQKVMVFKTVLLTDFMTDKQQHFYADAIALAKKSQIGFETFKEENEQLIRM
ncbi:hypothetical protein [Alteromonas sp. a30]|uniref:hypothetical protein n=1 Tax=Alteromonas sp. a30 TaxID=2730917 RepID=UPI002281CD24|nr:hypothetical protein [Alteromonas sp. a30]MCY7296008.1 hypothetical protein [Alteromonas sp. a30]